MAPFNKYIQVFYRGKGYPFLVPNHTISDDVWLETWKFIGEQRFGTWTGFLYRKPKCPRGIATQKAFAAMLGELFKEWIVWRDQPAGSGDIEHSEWLALSEDEKHDISRRLGATLAGIVADGPAVYRATQNDGAKIYLITKSELDMDSDFRDVINISCNK